jgi:hypothetical protein
MSTEAEKLNSEIVNAFAKPLAMPSIAVQELDPISPPEVVRRTFADAPMIEPLPIAAGGGTFEHPLQVIKSDDNKFKIRHGTVNNVVPRINGSELEPDLSSSPELSVSSSGVLFLEVNLDGNQRVSSVNIKRASSIPSDTNTRGHLLLSSYSYSSGAIEAFTDNLTGSQQVAICNNTFYWGVI